MPNNSRRQGNTGSALQQLQSLAATTGETAHLSHLVAGHLVAIAYIYPATHGMRVMMDDADRRPFHATASGHAVLS